MEEQTQKKLVDINFAPTRRRRRRRPCRYIIVDTWWGEVSWKPRACSAACVTKVGGIFICLQLTLVTFGKRGICVLRFFAEG